MTKKKTKESAEPRFEVKKREPKVKPNYFQNIPSFQHPLAEILNFPPSSLPNQIKILDTQISDNQTLKDENSGHSSAKKLDTQPPIILDTQDSTKLGTQNLIPLDTQPVKVNALKKENSGHSKNQNPGALAPKLKTDAPRKEEELGAQTPKKENSGHSKNDEWRKYDRARSTVRVNLHIDKNIDKKVRQYCMIDANPKVELKEFYERAAMHLLNFLDTQNMPSLGAETPLDDRRLKMMFKSKPFIINLYLAYNAVFNELSAQRSKGKWSARWTPRDDESAVRYNDIDPMIIELGIIQTQLNKGFGESKIQTFKYYIDEIENWLSSGVSDDILSSILQFHRSKWKAETGREIDLEFLDKNNIKD